MSGVRGAFPLRGNSISVKMPDIMAMKHVFEVERINPNFASEKAIGNMSLLYLRSPWKYVQTGRAIIVVYTGAMREFFYKQFHNVRSFTGNCSYGNV